MELTEKQKAAFQELAEWARKYGVFAEMTWIGYEDCEFCFIVDDKKFMFSSLDSNSVEVFRKFQPYVKESFKAKQQEGGK